MPETMRLPARRIPCRPLVLLLAVLPLFLLVPLGAICLVEAGFSIELGDRQLANLALVAGATCAALGLLLLAGAGGYLAGKRWGHRLTGLLLLVLLGGSIAYVAGLAGRPLGPLESMAPGWADLSAAGRAAGAIALAVVTGLLRRILWRDPALQAFGYGKPADWPQARRRVALRTLVVAVVGLTVGLAARWGGVG